MRGANPPTRSPTVLAPAGTSSPSSSTVPAKSLPRMPPYWLALSDRPSDFPRIIYVSFAASPKVQVIKLTVGWVLRRGYYLDENLTGTWFRDICKTEGRTGFRHDDCFLLNGHHCLFISQRYSLKRFIKVAEQGLLTSCLTSCLWCPRQARGMTDVFGKLLMKPVASYLTRTVSTRESETKPEGRA